MARSTRFTSRSRASRALFAFFSSSLSSLPICPLRRLLILNSMLWSSNVACTFLSSALHASSSTVASEAARIDLPSPSRASRSAPSAALALTSAASALAAASPFNPWPSACAVSALKALASRALVSARASSREISRRAARVCAVSESCFAFPSSASTSPAAARARRNSSLAQLISAANASTCCAFSDSCFLSCSSRATLIASAADTPWPFCSNFRN
mmetsp:Transcript_62647/g.125513  ORF Transcript_62647/g.125513 Transcript_62647/m.125513 type:complete len:216 (-) Transcript_62647:175-822(-)